MTRLLAVLRRRTVAVAAKAALACGLAFWLGSLLPAPVDEYTYYAALGAFTVVGLVVVDSVKESLQVLGAVAVGVAVALVVQNVAWTNAVTVAVTMSVAYLLGAARFFGVQRTWAPLAGLFVLASGGPDPQPIALGYLVQLPMGALVGLLVNVLLFPPLGDDDLEPATDRALRVLAGQMDSYADLLREQREEPDATDRREDMVHGNVVELEDAQSRLRSAITHARRAARGNPRIRRHARRRAAALDRAQAVGRCSAALMSVGVVLGQSAAPADEHSTTTRRHAETALRGAAEVFADPARVREQPDLLRDTEEAITQLLRHVRSGAADDVLDDTIFGSLGVTVRDCLQTFARHVAEVDLPGPAG